MKPLSRKEAVAVFVSLGVIAYLFFSAPLMSFFSRNAAPQTNTIMNNPGFSAQDITIGQGKTAAAGDRVSAHYVGKLPNGQVFDSSLDRGQPIQFILGSGQVIRGWDEGIVGMREGGKRILTISPEYGYGAQAVGPIPANSTLVFEVELVGVDKPQ